MPERADAQSYETLQGRASVNVPFCKNGRLAVRTDAHLFVCTAIHAPMWPRIFPYVCKFINTSVQVYVLMDCRTDGGAGVHADDHTERWTFSLAPCRAHNPSSGRVAITNAVAPGEALRQSQLPENANLKPNFDSDVGKAVSGQQPMRPRRA